MRQELNICFHSFSKSKYQTDINNEYGDIILSIKNESWHEYVYYLITKKKVQNILMLVKKEKNMMFPKICDYLIHRNV